MIIEWTEPAKEDLAEIHSFIARDVPAYAEQLIDRIIEAAGHLADHPKLGREVPEAKREDVRELICQGYRIIYLLQTDCLYIIAVVHGNRNLDAMKTQPWEAF